MIFVTVGTHEQQFNRLIQKVDELKRDGVIEDEVVIQTGFSTYEPKYCKCEKIFPYSEMEKNIQEARIVITHGGPSSFIMPLQIGKVPIVVPRKIDFNEHVNNHQVDFTNAVSERNGGIIVVEDVEKLGEVINEYDDLISKMTVGVERNNEKFCKEFERIVWEILQ